MIPELPIRKKKLSKKHDFKKNTKLTFNHIYHLMKIGIYIEIVSYLVNKTMHTTQKKNRKNLHWRAHFKSGKF